MNPCPRNASNTPTAGRISAYMRRYSTTLARPLSRMLCTESLRGKWYTDTPGILTKLPPLPGTPIDSPVLQDEELPGVLTLMLVYLWVDYYMRQPNLLGRQYEVPPEVAQSWI